MNRGNVWRLWSLMAVGATALASPSSAPAAHAVTLTGGEAPVFLAPVTVVVPEEFAGGPVKLKDLETGEFVAVQKDQVAGKSAITWIVDSLAPRATKKYAMEAGASPVKKGEGVEMNLTPQGLDVVIDGQPFTTYLIDAGPKPYCWPIIGPTGKPVTRAFPMVKDAPLEVRDHPHHRSFWFTHGKVGKNDFWSETPFASKTVHRDFQSVTSGPVFGEFVARVDWIALGGKKICEDARRLRVYRVPDARMMDFNISLKATDGELLIGDDKEGTFGFRVAGTMQAEALPKLKGKGAIVNSNGDRNGAAWGKRASWCDYYGPVDGQTVGIAIFDSPHNFRYPTYWHVREYGLFCANPFGLSFFTGDKSQNGSYTVPAGDSLKLDYRVYIHKGDESASKVAETFQGYAEPPKATVD